MKKLSLKKTAYWLHIWLGAISGLIVFIVAITGCIYAFQQEIRATFQPDLTVKVQDKPFLTPDELEAKAREYVFKTVADTANTISGVTYSKQDEAAIVAYMHYVDGYTALYLNPYTGDYIYEQIYKKDFFRFILDGHRRLWLPREIGKPIVGYGVLAFLIVLITGLIISLPKKWNKKTLKSTFTIKRKSSFFRLNYDLHQVLGIYVLLIAIVLSITGLTWSFQWFGGSYYAVISGGGELVRRQKIVSDTKPSESRENLSEKLWLQVLEEYPVGEQGTLSFSYPNERTPAYQVMYNSADNGTYYKRHMRYFDQNTLAEIEGGGIFGKSYDEASNADKLYRMNYDIHVGAIAGIWGKIIMFLVSLIIASFPITGGIMWYKKHKKKKKQLA